MKQAIGGQVTIKDLEEGIYYIYETKTAPGYYLEDQRDAYPDSNDPNGFAGNLNCVYLGNTYNVQQSTNWKNCSVGIDQIPLSTLTIGKIDKDDNTTKLSGVNLKIYGKLDDARGWVKEDGSLGAFYGAKEWQTGTDR